VQPIFPNNPMNCQIKIGNLKRITKPLLYSIISPDNGEIYTIGIALGKSVEKNLNAELKLLE
jgi:Lon-like ATP-dependent protease